MGARAELEAQHGYDTKHAMHLVRLLRMGEEILSTGRVNVRREDADELMAIRKGALSYDQLLEQSETLGTRIEAGGTWPACPRSLRWSSG